MTLQCDWCGARFEDTHCKDVASAKVLLENRDDIPTLCGTCNNATTEGKRTIAFREVRVA